MTPVENVVISFYDLKSRKTRALFSGICLAGSGKLSSDAWGIILESHLPLQHD